MTTDAIANDGDHQLNETEGQDDGQEQQCNVPPENQNNDDNTFEREAKPDSTTSENTDHAGGKKTSGSVRMTNAMTEHSSAAELWKTALSGSLDEKRMLFGLLLLSLFYVVYINVSAHQNSKNKDEYAITHNCSCRADHRSFYVSWTAFCCLVWVLIHIILTIPQINRYPFLQLHVPGREIFKKLFSTLTCGCFKIKKKVKANKSDDTKSTRRLSLSSTDDILESNIVNSAISCCTNFKMSCTKLKKAMYQRDAIHRYEYYLWTKYYELYVVGITKKDEKFSLQSIDSFINNRLCAHDATDGHQTKVTPKLEKEEQENKAAIYTALSHIQEGCSYGVQITLHLFLVLVLFLAQLAVIPLLMIQVFDTYAFLCFAADNYCTMESQFTLHFHQTVVTFGFYCSLMVSFLSSTMLRWIPWPTKRSY